VEHASKFGHDHSGGMTGDIRGRQMSGMTNRVLSLLGGVIVGLVLIALVVRRIDTGLGPVHTNAELRR
jgi:hypothetical protein